MTPHKHYQVYHNGNTPTDELDWLGQHWRERVAEPDDYGNLGDMGWKHEMIDADMAMQIVDSRVVPWSPKVAMAYQQDKLNGKVNH